LCGSGDKSVRQTDIQIIEEPITGCAVDSLQLIILAIFPNRLFLPKDITFETI
jgi:hypothetical protein